MAAALLFLLTGQSVAMPGFDAAKMSDMSDFNPNNPVVPTGDTIKIGVIEAFSGPGAIAGVCYNLVSAWVAHDINKRGGIVVDGKKKKIQLIKADDQFKPAVTKKVAKSSVWKTTLISWRVLSVPTTRS